MKSTLAIPEGLAARCVRNSGILFRRAGSLFHASCSLRFLARNSQTRGVCAKNTLRKAPQIEAELQG